MTECATGVKVSLQRLGVTSASILPVSGSAIFVDVFAFVDDHRAAQTTEFRSAVRAKTFLRRYLGRANQICYLLV